MVNLRRRVFAFVLSLTIGVGVAASPTSAAGRGQAASAAADSAKCPVQAADLDKITSYRWKFGRYQTNQVYGPTMTLGLRIDTCDLVGMDAKGRMVTGVTMFIAGGAQAAPFAKYWREVCANSLMPDQRGKVQPLPGVTGGFQCVTPKGSSSNYWVESGGRTVQMEAGTDDLVPLVPKLLGAVR